MARAGVHGPTAAASDGIPRSAHAGRLVFLILSQIAFLNRSRIVESWDRFRSPLQSHGLDLALEAMGDVDELLCLGDSIFEYQFSNDVVARLKERGAHIILGNHEEVFLSPAGIRARERDGIDPHCWSFWPSNHIAGIWNWARKRLLLIHSTPWEPRGEYVHPHSAKLDRFAEADADIVLYGHTHCQVVKRVGKVLVINPGSAGDGRDSRNDRQLSCAVLDTVSEEVRMIDYPDPRFGGG